MAEHKDYILFATADWDTPYWTNKQHTARALAKSGKRVLYIESIGLRTVCLNSNRDISRLWRRLKRGLRGIYQAEPNVWVYSPLLIPFKHHLRIVKAFNQGMLRWMIGRFIREQHFEKTVVWTYHPFILKSLPSGELGPIVYHCVDDLAAVPGIDADAFNAEEKLLLGRANIVFTTSPILRDKCLQYNAHVYDFPNVADIDHFRTALAPGALPSDLQSIPTPRIGYIGVLSDFKVDFELVLAVAKLRPNWQWVFIGEEREGQSNASVEALKQLSNTHFLGFKPYAELPAYLRGLDVATLPTHINDYTKSMFPMKYFEYLAAGVPVVSTPLAFTKQHSAGMETGDTSENFAHAIELQLQRGKLSLTESTQFVGENTWEARLQKMMHILENPT